VDIIGINITSGGSNALMFAGKSLSWVRDNAVLDVQSAWSAEYRDVMILDPLNRRITTFNLTSFDLSVAANASEVKTALSNAATLTDDDIDGLPDYWEIWATGSKAKGPDTIMADGRKLLSHYAHPSPAVPSSVPAGLPQMFALADGLGGRLIAANWRGRRGTALGLTLAPEFSATLDSWNTAEDYEEYSRRPLYDGSGGEVIEWRSVVPQPVPYIRVRATLPP
jgi:hypothetical protein